MKSLSNGMSMFAMCCASLFLSISLAIVASAADVSSLPAPSTRPVDFIKDIQPIFAQSCYPCHGPDKQQKDFRLDEKSSALHGGTSGVDIVPGHSADSRLIILVAGLDAKLVMPKKGARLSPEQISLLRAWIDQGAIWPDSVAFAKAPDKSDWWSFKPAIRPPLTPVKNQRWVRNPVDQFILAKLDSEGLTPSPEADRRTLIRRVTFDLTGLPPTPAEVESFLNDHSKLAYEKLVDRLLASPRYGERWARHWLDTVHFGETHGYDKDKPRPNAWPYRDYVIRAFNNDKPYSRFVQEQLAGDVLFPGEPDDGVALGFISAGPWDYVGNVELPIEKTDGLIARYNDRDDMVMTTISTFESLTVHCARCHNHKFDPISQRDYYSLQAVFAGVDRADRTYETNREVYVRRRELLAQKSPLEERHTTLTNQLAAVSSPEIRDLDSRLQKLKILVGVSSDQSPGNGYHSAIEPQADSIKWVQVDLGQSQPIDEIRLVPARPVDFAETPGFGFPVRFRVEVSDQPDFRVSEMIADKSSANFVNPGDQPVVFSSFKQRARYVRVTATKLWERTHDYVFAFAELQVIASGTNLALGSAVTALDSIESGLWSTKHLVDGYDSRHKLAGVLDAATQKNLESEIASLEKNREQLLEAGLSEAARHELAEVTGKLDEVNKSLAALPPPLKVYAATSDFQREGNFLPAKTPRPVYLLARGDVKKPGDLMRAAGLACVPGPTSQFEISDEQNEGLRRAALAAWITDPHNLMTRRSIVNRVWHFHFGRGIVETPNDFGHMGALPSHPELLDWLAYWFADHGESLKELHRLIVTSATYRQSSADNPAAEKVDADARFLWRMNRARLDAEEIHDTMLQVSGKLDLTMGGPSVQQFYFKDDHSPVYDYTRFDIESPNAARRSIYRFIVRSVPDPLMDSLDCPDASILTPKRNVTVTALQALATLNNPFVLKQCEYLAARVSSCGDTKKQIEQIYELTLNRRPTAAEFSKLLPFAERNGMASVCRLIFNTSEFMFLD